MKNKKKFLLITSADYYNFAWILVFLGLIIGTICKIFLAFEFMANFATALSLILWLCAGLCFWVSSIKRYKGGALTEEEAYAILERYEREYAKDRHSEKAELAAAIKVILDKRNYTPILTEEDVSNGEEVSDKNDVE